MRVGAFIAGCLIAFAPAAAKAEFQLSIYGGANTANNGDVTLKQGALSGTYGVEWFGESFETPPYYGVRGTYWLTNFNLPRWGVAIDVTHAKVAADLSAPALGAFRTLEFTNGINSATLDALYRMPLNNRFSLYAGAGGGISFPHVEVETTPSAGTTYEYQVTGPAAAGLIGASFELGYGVSVFSEYKAVYSWNKADLVGGGTLEADVLTHQFAIGLSLSLGPRPTAPY